MTLRRLFLKIMIRLVIIGLLVSGFFYYILGTESGMQLVWSGVASMLPEKMHVARVEGTLLSHVEVHDFVYDDDELLIEVKSMSAHWQVMPLLKKQIIIDTIKLDGVNMVVKPARQQQKSATPTWDAGKLVQLLGRIKLVKADFGTVLIKYGKATFTLAGTLDQNWHVQWSAAIPDFSDIAPALHGQLGARGNVQGARLQPVFQTDIKLARFVSEDVSIASITGRIRTQLQNSVNDTGSLQVTGLRIHDFRVPDFLLKTAGHWQGGAYQLQAAAILSRVNRVTAKLIIPAWQTEAGLNQTFQASAKADVQDFAQFNTLFERVPQVRAFKGRVTGAFTGTGTFLHPIFDGGLEAQGGSVFVPAAALKLDNIQLSTRYHTGQKVNLNGTFSARGGQGRLSGTYDIEDRALPLMLDVKADHVNVYDTKEYKIIISPAIHLLYQNDDLDLTGDYRSSLSSTNIIESLIGVAKTKMKNVKNWNYHSKLKSKIPRDKALRWTAMAIQSHREKMRRLRGGKEQIETLINKLNGLDSAQQAA